MMIDRGRRRSPRGAAGLPAALLCCALATACRQGPGAPGRPGERVTFEVKDARLVVEVACDGPSRQMGLMYRESLPEDAGMLFIFPAATKQSFWMHNTRLPLSIAFLDDEGKILQIEHMRPNDESHTLSMTKVRYALEVNKGWFARNSVHVGDTLKGFAERIRHFHVS